MDSRKQERLQERRELQGELDKVRAAHEKAVKPLEKHIDSAAAGRDKAQAALDTATTELNQAHAALMDESNRAENKVAELERKLVVTAPPPIGEFVKTIKDERDELRAEDTCRQVNPLGRRRDGKTVFEVSTDRASRERRLGAMRAAIESATALQYEALTDDDLAARLEGLRAALPGLVMERVVEKAGDDTAPLFLT